MSAAVLGLARGGHTVTLQQEPEHDPVRDEEERYDHGGNEIDSAQLTWVEPEGNSPIVRVEEIRGAPHVEHPHTGFPPGSAASSRQAEPRPWQ